VDDAGAGQVWASLGMFWVIPGAWACLGMPGQQRREGIDYALVGALRVSITAFSGREPAADN